MSGTKGRLLAFQASGADLNGMMKSTPVEIGSKVLIVEHPMQKLQRYPWDEAAKQRFHLNEAEADDLEHGAVLWRGSTAFMLERLGIARHK